MGEIMGNDGENHAEFPQFKKSLTVPVTTDKILKDHDACVRF